MYHARRASAPTLTRTDSVDQPISLDTVIGFLVATPFFDGLDSAERAEVVRIMEIQRFADGEPVFHEGDAGDAWYVIFEGQARVLKEMPSESAPAPMAVLGPGACFGEMAVLDGQARSATVQAEGPLTTFRFRRSRFDELLEQGSLGAYKLVAAMARSLSHRHRELTQRVSELMDGGRRPARSVRDSIGKAVDRYQVSE